MLGLWRKRAQRTRRHPDLGRLTFRDGLWRGEIPHADSTILLSLESAEREPEAAILQVALEAVRGLDRFVAVARGFLAFQPAYGGATELLMPVGVSVARPDPREILTRLLNEKTLPLRYAPHGEPIWGLQLQAPGGAELLEVFFFRGIPMFADHRRIDEQDRRRGLQTRSEG